METKIGTSIYNRERTEKLNKINSILRKNYCEIILPYKTLNINGVFIGLVSLDGIMEENANKYFLFSELTNIQLECIISNIEYYDKKKRN